MNKKFVIGVFVLLVFSALLTPFWVFKDLLFPFVTSKAFYLRIVVELALPFYVYLVLRYKEYRPSLRNPLSISVLAFLFINFIAAIFGANVLRSFWGNFERMGGVFYTAHLVLLYFYVLLFGQISVRLFRAFLQGLLVIGGLVSFDGIMVWLTHNHFLLNDPSYPRVSGSFGNPIYIASFLVIPVFIAAFLAFNEEIRWKKIGYWLLALMQTWVIFLSATRGAIVGLGIGIFIAAVLYIVLNPIRKVRIWGSYAVLGFVVVLGLLFSFHNSLPQGTTLRRVFNLKDSNTEARLIQWKVALHGVGERPVLGYGPENYYVVSNQFYNPEIFQYDASWFDKPHNYWIEVMVTSGILGFIAYAGILVFSLWSFWKGYKSEILSLEEFCVLVCGFIVYQIQNLFVFDTVAASVAFFAFCGMAAYIWFEATKTETAKKPLLGLDQTFSSVVFGIVGIAAIYLIVVCNAQQMSLGKDVNYGYAYASVDPATSQSYFDKAFNSSFNFDPVQTANKYADLAIGLAGGGGKNATSTLQNAIDQEKKAIAVVPNDPTAWQELCSLYLEYGLVTQTVMPQEAFDAAHTAINLAPRRPEPLIALSQLQLYSNDTQGAQATLEQEVQNTPGNLNAKMQLAIIYSYNGQTDKAVQLGESVLASGYQPRQAREVTWLADIYMERHDINNSIRLYTLATQLDPNDFNSYWNLAQAYAQGGQKQTALQIAQQLLQKSPENATTIQKFIDSLK